MCPDFPYLFFASLAPEASFHVVASAGFQILAVIAGLGCFMYPANLTRGKADNVLNLHVLMCFCFFRVALSVPVKMT